MKNKRILFVDDEKNILQALRRMLSGMRNSWHMEFAEGGREALIILAEEPFDIIVTDMRMPEMDGLELLKKVKTAYPHMARIILSGDSDKEQLLKATRIAHQFLAKPCAVETLKGCILTISSLQDNLEPQSLRDHISNITSLPSIPSSYTAIMEEINNPHCSMKRIGEIIEQDLSMAAKILQLINSAFFGLPRKISRPYDATCLLGIDIVRSLVMAIGVFSQFEKNGVDLLFLNKLFHHGLLTGSHAMKIARSESIEKETADSIFMSGLFHDIGKLVLIENFGKTYREILKTTAKENTNLSEAEKQAFGATHGEIGGYLLGLWGFSQKTVQAVVCHHNPSTFTEMELGVVYAANILAHDCSNNPQKSTALTEHDCLIIVQQGMLHRFEAWQTSCCSDGTCPDREEISAL